MTVTASGCRVCVGPELRTDFGNGTPPKDRLGVPWDCGCTVTVEGEPTSHVMAASRLDLPGPRWIVRAVRDPGIRLCPCGSGRVHVERVEDPGIEVTGVDRGRYEVPA